MRTTLAIDDDLLAKAQAYTGLKEEIGTGARSAESPDRAGGRTPIGSSWRQRAGPDGTAAAADSEEVILDRHLGMGRSPPVRRPDACATAEFQRGLGAPLRDRRACPRQFAATSTYPGDFWRSATDYRRVRSGSAAFHRPAKVVRVGYRLRRHAFAGSSPAHCRHDLVDARQASARRRTQAAVGGTLFEVAELPPERLYELRERRPAGRAMIIEKAVRTIYPNAVSRSINLFLADMALTDRVQSPEEVLDRAAFFRDRLEIDEQDYRLVVTGRGAALDFSLDLAPDVFTAPRDGGPAAPGALFPLPPPAVSVPRLPFPLSHARERDVVPRRGRAIRLRCARQLVKHAFFGLQALANLGLQLGCHMRVTFEQSHKQAGLLAVRHRRNHAAGSIFGYRATERERSAAAWTRSELMPKNSAKASSAAVSGPIPGIGSGWSATMKSASTAISQSR